MRPSLGSPREFGLLEKYHHDLCDDVDARESWGGLCTVISGVFG